MEKLQISSRYYSKRVKNKLSPFKVGSSKAMAKNLTISEFMTTNVAHVDADEKILAIAKKMRRKNISCVMVLEKKAETSQENISPSIPIGIITNAYI